SKLQPKWVSYYRIIEKLSDRTLLIKNKLDNEKQVRKANIAEWGIPKSPPPGILPVRNCRYVVASQRSAESSTCDESESNDQTKLNGQFARQRRRMTKMHRHVRENYSDEDHLP
ncbi:hypothetical protein MAR_020841, partial [Mya arenaria]